jgi:ribulose bisphosphate carboxylase small subunit
MDDLKEKKGYWSCKKKHEVAQCGELALEEVMDLSSDRLRNELFGTGLDLLSESVTSECIVGRPAACTRICMEN